LLFIGRVVDAEPRDAGMAAISRKVDTLGELDDVTVADIIATGASLQELAEAKLGPPTTS
jgi:hypothetical protein